MKISSGCTRVVLIVGNKAYKIAKFRPFILMLKLFHMLFISQEYVRLYEKHKHNKSGIVIKVLCGGLAANRAEWHYWNSTHDSRCSPSLSMWLKGLVLVQERVEAVTESQVLSSPLGLLWQSDEEFAHPSQFGRTVEGKIVIVDYATLA